MSETERSESEAVVLGYKVRDRVHVPGKGMGYVSFVKGGTVVAVHFDKTFRWRNTWWTVKKFHIDEVLPWECGIHEDCIRYPDLGRDCILSRVARLSS